MVAVAVVEAAAVEGMVVEEVGASMETTDTGRVDHRPRQAL